MCRFLLEVNVGGAHTQVAVDRHVGTEEGEHDAAHHHGAQRGAPHLGRDEGVEVDVARAGLVGQIVERRPGRRPL